MSQCTVTHKCSQTAPNIWYCQKEHDHEGPHKLYQRAHQVQHPRVVWSDQGVRKADPDFHEQKEAK